jgi:hypothetical protein
MLLIFTCRTNLQWLITVIIFQYISTLCLIECARVVLFSSCWLIDYLMFYVLLKNFSLIWRRKHCRWRAEACARRSGPLSREGSLSCHTCCDTGPRFLRSHPKDRPI